MIQENNQNNSSSSWVLICRSFWRVLGGRTVKRLPLLHIVLGLAICTESDVCMGVGVRGGGFCTFESGNPQGIYVLDPPERVYLEFTPNQTTLCRKPLPNSTVCRDPFSCGKELTKPHLTASLPITPSEPPKEKACPFLGISDKVHRK